MFLEKSIIIEHVIAKSLFIGDDHPLKDQCFQTFKYIYLCLKYIWRKLVS